jgi:hypothetical protein
VNVACIHTKNVLTFALLFKTSANIRTMDEKVGIIYQGLKKPGRRGAIKEISTRVGCTQANVSSVLRGKSKNDMILLVASQLLHQYEQKDEAINAAINQNLAAIL